MDFRINLPMIDSRCFARTGVSDIGLTSDSIADGGFTFGMGVMFAHFHILGTTPSRKEELKIAHMGPERRPARSANTQLGMPSGPAAFLTFVSIKHFSTVSMQMMNSSGTVSIGGLLAGLRGVRCSDTE